MTNAQWNLADLFDASDGRGVSAHVSRGGGRTIGAKRSILGELLRGGDVGYELQLDPIAPVWSASIRCGR